MFLPEVIQSITLEHVLASDEWYMRCMYYEEYDCNPHWKDMDLLNKFLMKNCTQAMIDSVKQAISHLPTWQQTETVWFFTIFTFKFSATERTLESMPLNC